MWVCVCVRSWWRESERATARKGGRYRSFPRLSFGSGENLKRGAKWGKKRSGKLKDAELNYTYTSSRLLYFFVHSAMKKTFVCDDSMIITIPLGGLMNIREVQLMPEMFHCVFKDFYKVFAINGRPKPLGVSCFGALELEF